MTLRGLYTPSVGGSSSSTDGVVPVGGIILWSGTIASIPATWALCDGTANAPGPDLRDKFIVGAKQDDSGVAKTNIEGSLKQSGGVTGHSHSGHANLTHAGGAVADHTGLTHGLTIADHPDLTHAALSHAASTFAHADHSVPSFSHTHAASTVTHADHSVASFSGTQASGTFSVPSGTFSVPSQSHTPAYEALTYPDKHAYQVDNTRISPAYFELLRSKGIDCTHLVPWPDWDRTFLRCWELILERAKALDCYWVFSVEADNIPAPESLDVMVNIALYGNAHLVTHAYPMHATAARASGIPEDSWYYHELGCMLMSRSLLEKALADFEEYGNMAAAIFGTESRYLGGYLKLTNKFKVEHLDGYEMSFQNLGPSQIPGLICPTPQMPADYGSVTPPCLVEG